MASLFSIPGACKLFTGATELGMSPAEPSIECEEIIAERQVHTSESGPDLPAAVIHTGRKMRIVVPLNKWDQTQIDTLRKPVGASAAGQIGTLGGQISTFSLSIVPTQAGKTKYTFPYARFVDSIKLGPFGITEQILALVFEAIPDPSALSTATTTYYTTAST